MEDTGTQQPGQTITPTKSTPPAPSDASQRPPEPPAPEPPAEPAEPPQPASPPEPETPDEQPFKRQQPAVSQPEPDVSDTTDTKRTQTVTWTASEFIAHAKSIGWYTSLVIAAIAIAAVVLFITKDVVSVGVVIIGAILLGIYGGHQPRQLEYQLNANGLNIGQKHLGYNQFRSFSVIPEDAFDSIVFMPLKRFAVPTTIYFAPEDKDKIVSMLADRLPFEERGHDAIDRLMQRIRF
jgi:hypothetical protein